MNIRPTRDNIIVRPIEESTKSGIVLARPEKPQRGKVIMTGNAVVSVSPGDIISFNKYAGTEVKTKEETVLILREVDILAIEE
jgi:chaperonin GroES